MAIKVNAPGLATTVQDLGRPGYYHLGIPLSGGMDRFALRAANLLVHLQQARRRTGVGRRTLGCFPSGQGQVRSALARGGDVRRCAYGQSRAGQVLRRVVRAVQEVDARVGIV